MIRKILTILLITVVAISFAMVPQPAYAGTYPEIWDMQGDRYLYPGEESVELFVYLDRAVDKVDLMYNNNGTWINFGSCTSENSYNDYWSYTLYQSHAPKYHMEFQFRIGYGNNSGIRYSDTFIVEWTSQRNMSRIYGDDRFDTAKKISHSILDVDNNAKYDYIIVASGMSFADALSGASLSAARGNAPILLVSDNPKVIQDIADEIASNLTSTGAVYILGGEAAVPKTMEEALAKKGIYSNRVLRFNGKDRYDTNMKILEFCEYSMDMDQIMLCSGTSFADALSASAVGLPIMLVGKELNLDQEAFFMAHDPFIYLVGGEGAVSKAIADELQYGFEYKYHRFDGEDRYQTSAYVAESFFPHQPYYAVLAYGRNFPDGLAGGPLAHILKAPLLLVEDSAYMPAEEYFHWHDPRYAVVLGGPSLISDYTAKRILERFEYAVG